MGYEIYNFQHITHVLWGLGWEPSQKETTWEMYLNMGEHYNKSLKQDGDVWIGFIWYSMGQVVGSCKYSNGHEVL